MYKASFEVKGENVFEEGLNRVNFQLFSVPKL